MGSACECIHFRVTTTTWVIIEELRSQNTRPLKSHAFAGYLTLTRTHKSHTVLTNLSCLSAAQCLPFSQTHKTDTPLVESMDSSPVLMRTRLRCHSSSLDSHFEQQLASQYCFSKVDYLSTFLQCLHGKISNQGRVDYVAKPVWVVLRRQPCFIRYW